MFKRHTSPAQCFFCHHAIPVVKDPRNFRCPECECWNRYDQFGVIQSSEASMYDESLNKKAYSKRASPSKNRLPTAYSNGPFCHDCQTNQMLLLNLLSNYLPEPSSPDYQRRLEMLPEYRESLHKRYPQVCENCLHTVEEEIQRKDDMARATALGGWLKQTKKKERQRRVSGTPKEREQFNRELAAWRLRGALWIACYAVAIFGYSCGALGYQIHWSVQSLPPVLLVGVSLSPLWAFWDPTYAAYRKANLQGRDLQLQGKQHYIVLQSIVLGSRLLSSIGLLLEWRRPDFMYKAFVQGSTLRKSCCCLLLFVELAILLRSCFTLRLRKPPTIRLIDTTQHKAVLSRSSTPQPGSEYSPSSRGSTPLASEPDLLASLTLSSKPVLPPKSAAVFGVPSFAGVPNHGRQAEDPDAMDWSPTEPLKRNDPGGFQLRPQRFFAPERPTGLEELFQQTRLVDNQGDIQMSDSSASQDVVRHMKRWWWVAALVVAFLSSFVLVFWQRTVPREIVSQPPQYVYVTTTIGYVEPSPINA